MIASVLEPDKVALAQSSDPRQHQTTPPVKAPPQPTPTHPTANATPDVQSTLLALLSQAANAVASTNGWVFLEILYQ